MDHDDIRISPSENHQIHSVDGKGALLPDIQ